MWDIWNSVPGRSLRAFFGAMGVYFGIYEDALYQRTVVRNGVVALPRQGGQAYMLFVMKEGNTLQAITDILNRDMSQYLLEQRMVLIPFGQVIFFRIVGSPGPHPSLMLSDRDLDLFIPEAISLFQTL
jgi:hypothetical protein